MISVLKKYLERNRHSHVVEEFKDLHLSHPNYPSLYSITDTLDVLGIENMAANVPKNQLENLPDSFIASIKSGTMEGFVFVSKSSDIITYETESDEKHSLPIDEFRDLWDGLILAVEKNEKAADLKKSNLILPISFGLLVLIFLVSIFAYGFEIYGLIFRALSLAGLFVSIFILQEKNEEANELVSKICSFSANTSCDSVIKSKNSQITKWLSFTDLPILFFSINFMAVSLGNSSLGIIGLLSILSVPVCLYSIYLQKAKLKKWCILCLVISSLVIGQSVLYAFNTNPLGIHLTAVIRYSIIAAICTTIWFYTKKIMEERKDLANRNKDLFRFKRNFSLFDFLSSEVKEQDELIALKPISIGNSDAALTLRLFLSPSCGHCHTAYKKGKEFAEMYPEKVKLAVYFNLNIENSDNPYLEIARNLLEIHFSGGNILEAIEDWHVLNLELDNWLKKWKQQTISMEAEMELNNQYRWCVKNEFNYTPVKIIDHKLLPREYEIDEIKYFLSELEDQKTEKSH